MSEKSFDASRYLRKLNGKDYLEVKWRLLWLRTEHPEAVISTELVKHETGLALFQARVALPEGGEATGWGSETSSDFSDYIEAAETKALGRALAALGYGTQFCEDFDFSAEAARETQRRWLMLPSAFPREVPARGRRGLRRPRSRLSTPSPAADGAWGRPRWRSGAAPPTAALRPSSAAARRRSSSTL